jgi:Protein of unknown function (DUF4232)
MQSVSRSPRRLIAAAAGIASIAAIAIPVSSAAGSGRAAASPPPCGSIGTIAWLNTNSNAAAGSVFFKLQFTNLSGRRCSLRGFPGVSAVDTRGHQLGRAASRDNGTPVRTIALSNGVTARATLRIVQVGNFPASTCRPVTAAGLRIFPPNQSAAKFVPFPFRACSRSGPVYLSVRAVTH